ncbi:hypothetical protein HPB47_023603 [Ixodes persulcatus]|uniref:Uncharacterized protein n=1 Tax=Ixodes persulcatus TaxID=34615 RepID=A0AC60Q9K2_IXOPE|nr:hypothetical protein HPB47_023603 [Ixodes persulcatus]
MPRSTFSPAGTSVVKESGRQLPQPSAGGRHRPRRALCSAAARLNGLRGSARRHKVPPCRSLRRPHSRDDPPSTAARIRPYVAASLLLLRPSLRRWTGLPRRVNGRWPVCEPAPVSSVSFSTTWATLPGCCADKRRSVVRVLFSAGPRLRLGYVSRRDALSEQPIERCSHRGFFEIGGFSPSTECDALPSPHSPDVCYSWIQEKPPPSPTRTTFASPPRPKGCSQELAARARTRTRNNVARETTSLRLRRTHAKHGGEAALRCRAEIDRPVLPQPATDGATGTAAATRRLCAAAAEGHLTSWESRGP